MGLIKFVLAIGFIILIALGTIFGGLIGFVITFIMALVISGMFSRTEKQEIDQLRHEEILRALKDNNNIEPVANHDDASNKKIEEEPTTKQPTQVYNTATGKMEPGE
jgi:predicted lipid-binding transport protein (Tim44 family)